MSQKMLFIIIWKVAGLFVRPKNHDLWLEEPLVGTECCLPLVALSDSDIVETPLDIQLGKVKYLAPWSRVISSEMSGIG